MPPIKWDTRCHPSFISHFAFLTLILLVESFGMAWAAADSSTASTGQQIQQHLATPWRPSWPKDDWNMAHAEVDSQKTCLKSETIPLPQADLPTAEDLTKLKSCKSAALYYGYTGKPDYVRARKCAYLERISPDQIIAGSSILAMIYANGLGVQRDLPLAIKFACEAGGAPAEIDGRIYDLEQREVGKSSPAAHPFDFCDDVTSGYMQGACEGISADADAAKREQTIQSLTKGYSSKQEKAFAALRKDAYAYFKAHAKNEIDLSGTDRAAISLGDIDAHQESFLTNLQTFEAGRVPRAADSRLVEAHLNAIYRRVLANPDLKPLPNTGEDVIMTDDGTITADGIRVDQRLWLAYRDAWVGFAKLLKPNVAATDIESWLTRQRTAELRGMLPATDPEFFQTGEH